MRGFLSCFRCLFLDRASVLPSSSRARLLRVAPLSWVPSLGLKEQSCRQSWYLNPGRLISKSLLLTYTELCSLSLTAVIYIINKYKYK